MNFAIVDDNKADCSQLAEYVERYCSLHHLFTRTVVFHSGEEFLGAFRASAFDIVFLDIYLQDANGLDLARQIRERDPDCILIFSTTSNAHAVESYRVRAYDYLLKPYSYEQFTETFYLCDKALMKRAHFIEIKEGRALIKVLLSSIVYVDYYNHYVQLHTKDRMIKSYMQFERLMELLTPYPQFLYCYRNCVINMDEVDVMENLDFVLKNGERIPIARSGRARIRQRYADYAFLLLDGEV